MDVTKENMTNITPGEAQSKTVGGKRKKSINKNRTGRNRAR